MNDPMQPPDPVCKFCEDWCGGTCEGALEARTQEVTDEITRSVFGTRRPTSFGSICDYCGRSSCLCGEKN